MIPTLLPFVLLLPLAGFAFNGIFGSRIRSEGLIGAIGSGTVGISFILGVIIFFELLAMPAHARQVIVDIAPWIAAGRFSISFSYMVDPLSTLFLLIVTGVGFLIHVYSIGYMRGDRSFFRFFAYLNLFIFMMLNLVMADNLVVTFLGWEGVGLASFLLIGFWYERPFDGVGIHWTGDAAKKAFVVNRIGDLGMLVGMFILFSQFGTLHYAELTATVSAAGFAPGQNTMITVATLCLFLGACGKSAQIPLSVWLPDAMAGPTPVSALIHAATMVTSGVFLLSRMSALFTLAPTTMAIVTGIATATAFMAATIALVQTDIKKVLAYSTVSQLGFMFMALGVGAFTAAVFHVMTHAFFKALLFLGSGSVIHGMHEEQDMRRMGGLRKYMPQTYRTYVIAALAISGFPLLSGFFSKDEILVHTWSDGGVVVWIIGAVAALFTAIYIFRSVFMTFDGEEHFDAHHVHPHESPAVMTIPLWILAVLAIFGGYLGLPPLFGEHANLLSAWLAPVFEPAYRNFAPNHVSEYLELSLMIASSLIAIGGIAAAWYLYRVRPQLAEDLATRFAPLHQFLYRKWYIDELYQKTIVVPLRAISREVLLRVVDKGIIDGIINGSGWVTGSLAGALRRIQTGVVQNYIAVFLAGIVLVVVWLAVR